MLKLLSFNLLTNLIISMISVDSIWAKYVLNASSWLSNHSYFSFFCKLKSGWRKRDNIFSKPMITECVIVHCTCSSTQLTAHKTANQILFPQAHKYKVLPCEFSIGDIDMSTVWEIYVTCLNQWSPEVTFWQSKFSISLTSLSRMMGDAIAVHLVLLWPFFIGKKWN